MMSVKFFLLLSSIFSTAFCATYTLSDNYVGSNFLSTFTHEAIADPTHGRVNYVDQATAVAKNLTFASGNTLILRADSTTTLSPSGPGRNSVRIKSVKTYTTHVAVFDVRHMPQGCGTWPAAWETNEATWPNDGEVDIVGILSHAPILSYLSLLSSPCSTVRSCKRSKVLTMRLQMP
ncbi:Glycoside hydrolase family 16 protein [Abortiporus biennis]